MNEPIFEEVRNALDVKIARLMRAGIGDEPDGANYITPALEEKCFDTYLMSMSNPKGLVFRLLWLFVRTMCTRAAKTLHAVEQRHVKRQVVHSPTPLHVRVASQTCLMVTSA